VFMGIGMIRTAYQLPLVAVLIPSYVLLFLFLYLAPPQFVPVAFDSGGAATGPLSVPFILAFSVGVVSVLGRANGVRDSFGLVALASIGPVIVVLLLGVMIGGLRGHERHRKPCTRHRCNPRKGSRSRWTDFHPFAHHAIYDAPAKPPGV